MVSIIRQIAEALLELQQSGKVKYIGWQVTLPCYAEQRKTAHLKSIALNLERESGEWKEEVDAARQQFYELNYYTVKQLLNLREELGKLKSDTEHYIVVDPHVMTLLQSISPEVSNDLIKRAIENLHSPEPQTSSSNEETPTNSGLLSVSGLSGDSETNSNVPTYVSMALTSPIDDTDVEVATLSKLQQEIYSELIDYYGFSNELAKEAIYVCEDCESAAEWCLNNQDQYESQQTAGVTDDTVQDHQPISSEITECGVENFPLETNTQGASTRVFARSESSEVDW